MLFAGAGGSHCHGSLFRRPFKRRRANARLWRSFRNVSLSASLKKKPLASVFRVDVGSDRTAEPRGQLLRAAQLQTTPTQAPALQAQRQ